MNFLKNLLIYFYMLPALLIGIIAMVANDIPVSIWILNLLIWFFGTMVGADVVRRPKKEGKKVKLLYLFLITNFLVLTYLFPGIDYVKRWITIGPLDIYIASIVLPLFIILLWKFAPNNNEYLTMGLVLFVQLILLVQPDAGQVTALACATVLILWKTIKNEVVKVISIILSASLVVLSWVFLDDLAPVSYVEEILYLVADLGLVWFILGIMSLLLLLFLFFFYGKNNIISISLGIYFLVSILVTFFGNFPMPIMGYGVSPIIGYIIAITWLKKEIKTV